jgi:Holliday junction resolvasome RuvABC endonuclease subunit
MKYRMGIDPDKKGAVFVIDKDMKEAPVILDVPLVTIETKDGPETAYNLAAMVAQLAPYRGNAKAVLEHQRSYGFGDNAKTLAKLCFGYGAWAMALTVCGIPFITPEPKQWKVRMLGSKNASKHDAVDRAKELFPEVAKLFLITKNGRADAGLMAYYGILLEKDAQ